jgi:hypothetical protein
MEGRKLEIVSEITYSEIKLESRRQKAKITTIGNYSQIVIDKCLTTMPNMKVSMLHQSSRSWFRASSITKLNKNQLDAHLF